MKVTLRLTGERDRIQRPMVRLKLSSLARCLILCGLFAAVGTPAVLREACAQNETDDSPPIKTDQLGEIPGPVRVREVGGQVIAEPVELTPAIPNDVPAYFLSKLQFNGVVIDNRAEISAEIHISITRDDVWQDVPLRMPEAHVVAADYDGKGEYTMASTVDRSDGLTWKFRGAGEHRLFLELEVPLKRSANGQKLELTLPKLEAFFRGTMTLTLPGAPLDVTANGADIKSSDVVNGKTRIDATVPGVVNTAAGPQVSFVWAKRLTATPDKIELVENDLELSLEPSRNRLRLSVRQRLQGVDRNLTSFRMSLPDGFEVLRVKGDRYREDRRAVDEDGQQFATVQLNDDFERDVELEWVLMRPFDGEAQTINVSGFKVEDVNESRTMLSVIRDDDYRLSVDWDNVSGAKQETPLLQTAVAAIEATEASFVIPIEIRKERPSISVAPYTEITLTNAEAYLRTEFRIVVDRGRVDELAIDWANGPRGDWLDLRVESIGDELYDADGRSRIRLGRSREGEFSVVLTARKEIANSAMSSLSLPTILAETSSPTRLTVRAIDSVEAEIDGEGEARLVRIKREFNRSPIGTERSVEGEDFARVVGRFVVSGEPAVINVTREIRQMARTASTSVEVRALRLIGDPRLSVELSQEIDLNVAYGRVSQVVLRVPTSMTAGLPQAVALEDLPIAVDGEPIARSQIESAGDGLARLTFRAAKSEARIEIGPFPYSFASDSPTDGVLPIVEIFGVGFESLKCRVSRDGLFVVEPTELVSARAVAVEPGWVQSVVTPTEFVTWVHTDPPRDVDGIKVNIRTGARAAESLFGVKLAETEIVRDVHGFSVEGRYDLTEVAGAMTVGIPATAESVRFTWNGADVSNLPRVSSEENGRTAYQVRTGTSQSGVLGVRYRLAAAPLSSVAADEVMLPDFPPGVWVERAMLEYLAPSDRHLIGTSGAITPEFEWKRRGLIWSRMAETALSFSSVENRAAANAYLFSSAVLPKRVTLRTVQGSILILLGAVTTFALAFVLYAFPRIRQVPVFLAIGILIAFAGLVDGAVLQVFLQPAALGLALAVMAIAIDRFRHPGSPRAPILTVVTESEFSSPSVLRQSESEHSVEETVIRKQSPSVAKS